MSSQLINPKKGLTGKPANSPLPPRAFSGVENEFKVRETQLDSLLIFTFSVTSLIVTNRFENNEC